VTKTKKDNFHIILGSRSKSNAESAITRLKTETGLTDVPQVSTQIIDLNDTKSIESAAEAIKKEFGGIDILINNAGMAHKGSAFNELVARTTVDTNYYGTLTACKYLLPLMRENGRVVNVSSIAGRLALRGMSEKWRSQFLSDDLAPEKLDELMESFIRSVAKAKATEDGWPGSAYGMSKAGLTMATRLMARENKTKGVLINAVCPGWCRTDMAGDSAPLSAAEGALRVLLPAFLPVGDTTTGKFFHENKVTSYV